MPYYISCPLVLIARPPASLTKVTPGQKLKINLEWPNAMQDFGLIHLLCVNRKQSVYRVTAGI